MLVRTEFEVRYKESGILSSVNIKLCFRCDGNGGACFALRARAFALGRGDCYRAGARRRV